MWLRADIVSVNTAAIVAMKMGNSFLKSSRRLTFINPNRRLMYAKTSAKYSMLTANEVTNKMALFPKASDMLFIDVCCSLGHDVFTGFEIVNNVKSSETGSYCQRMIFIVD